MTYGEQVQHLLSTRPRHVLLDDAHTVLENCALYHFSGDMHEHDFCTLVAAFLTVAPPRPRVITRTMTDAAGVRDAIG